MFSPSLNFRGLALKRLLIVEDDSNTLSGLLDLLSDEGYQVHGVTQGHEALKVIAKEPFDMVLCDYSLPDIDGLQVCRKIKTLHPGLAVFLSTAYYDTKMLSTAKEYGITRIFIKPFILEELMKSLLFFSNTSDANE